jgi:[ribosomal protein S5]-alanine N-acetyltransferase
MGVGTVVGPDDGGTAVARLLAPVLPAGVLAGEPQPILETSSGVRLRPWSVEDADVLAAVYADPEIQHWHHRAMDRSDAVRWIADTAHRWAAETDAEWAVVDPDDLPVGRVALRGIALDIGQAEVSYWTAPAARGAGIAGRATGRLATWALEEVGFWRLVIRHSARNPASCRVAVTAGFAHEADLALAHLHDDGWHDVHVHTRFNRTAGR